MSGIFERVRLRDIGTMVGGATPSTSVPEYWNGVIPWTTSKAIGDSIVLAKGERQITELGLKESSTSLIPKGQLLIGTRVGVGKAAVTGTDIAISQDLTGLIVNTDRFDPVFVAFALREPSAQAEFVAYARGTTIKGIPREDLAAIELPAPPLDVQKAIAAVLSQAQKAIEAQDALIAVARQLKRTAMHEVFTRGLRGEAQKATEIGTVPRSWDVVDLGSLGRIGNGSTPKKTVYEYWHDGKFPWLTSSKVYDRDITSADQFVTAVALRSCHLPVLEAGAVLIAITGQGKTLGHCAVLRTRATVSQHVAYLSTDLQKADPSFIRGYLETQYDYLRQVGSGGGSTKGALTCAFLRNLPVPLPPTLEEQHEIVATLNAIDQKIDFHRRKRAVLEDLFKALLRKLMTGEIRVTDLDPSALTTQATSEATS